MSILTYNGKFGKIGGKVVSIQSANLIWKVKGKAFLQWLYNETDPYAQPLENRQNGFLYFSSSSPNKAIINYGDGVLEHHNFIEYNGSYYLAFSSQIGWPANAVINNYAPIENHIFQDGYEGKRSVSIQIIKPESIKSIISNVVIFYEKLPSAISSLDVENISISNCLNLTEFPFEWSRIESLTSLILRNISSSYILTFPVSFIQFKLTRLSVQRVFDFSNIVVSKMGLISNYGGVLDYLDVSGCKVLDIPPEWVALTGLTELHINSSSFSTVPNNINLITSIKYLDFGGGVSFNDILTGWGDFSELINIERLKYSASKNFSTDFPAWLSSLTKLKNIDANSTYQTQVRIDEAVNNIYDFIINNAAIIGNSTLPFRGMTFLFYLSIRPELNPRPSGTYQQPAGYIQGIDNGTPVSPLEKIWVMVNQYAHTWSINPN